MSSKKAAKLLGVFTSFLLYSIGIIVVISLLYLFLGRFKGIVDLEVIPVTGFQLSEDESKSSAGVFSISSSYTSGAPYFAFAKSFLLFVGYVFLCVYLPIGLFFVPCQFIADFIGRPKYVG